MTPDSPAAQFHGLPTAAISDALDRIGIEGALHGIRPLRNDFRAVGPAFTVRYEPVDERHGTVGDFLDQVPEGAVVVIDNQEHTEMTVWGGIMTGYASARGIAGTVINGVCRDVDRSLANNYPIFSVGRYMRTGKDRVQLAAVQEELQIAGIRVAPGDVVCADADGVVVVPASRADEVAEIAAQIDSVEGNIVHAVTDGSSLSEARVQFGYHQLQTRRSNSA